ncbi:MAG TPA: hypothetical protein VNZ55_13430 [Thermomicrobiales bacterium]|nr:hypothetical protein [Thermomicrobiales bacterium]
MANPITFDDLSAQLDAIARNDPGAGPASAPAPFPPTPLQPRAASPVPLRNGDNAVQEADLMRMVSEARSDVKRQMGIWGRLMHQLRGDEFQRREVHTMLARIDAYNVSEEAKLAMRLYVSLRVLIHQLAVSAMAEMESYTNGFLPESRAYRLGKALEDQTETALLQTANQYATAGGARSGRHLGVER